MASASGPEATLEGAVEHVTFYNPENGFSVVRLRVRGHREPVAVVGTLPAVQPGERLVLEGHWHTDARHGDQFRPQRAQVCPPAALEDIQRYLGSGLIRQIGTVLARRIVETFGEATLEVLDEQPQRVREVQGVGAQRASSIAAAWTEHRALRGVAGFLSEHGLDTRYAPRLLAAYGVDAPRVLAANPYRLVGDVPGLGFAAADRLGRTLGVRPTAVARLQAAVQAALLRAAERGDTRLSADRLATSAAELAGLDATAVQPAIAQLQTAGTIARTAREQARDPAPGPGHGPLFDAAAPGPGATPAAVRAVGRLRIYEPVDAPAPGPGDGDAELGFGLRALVRAEESLASDLARLAARRAQIGASAVERWLEHDVDARRLSDEQRAAVTQAAQHGCFVLTGGPGVGKTTTVRVLVRMLQDLGRSVALAAPTGKAAKRLGEVAGLEASTVHRLLGAGPGGFRHGPSDPVQAQVIVVDEASMLDTQLARFLVAAVGPSSQLILVGDADQLPSVGPGQVLRDLLASGVVPSAQLGHVFRQAAQSRIVANAHRIRQGQMPELAPAAALLRTSDCVFVPASAERLAAVATEWAAARLPRALGCGAGEIQTLAPLTRVCQVLNSHLQQRLNPPGEGRPERPHGALALRLGDRVIQTRNNYTLEIFNGDTGRVVGVEPHQMRVDFGDGHQVDYAPADLLDVEHAYCLTVHRSQGSEWRGVVVLVSSSFGPMLSRNLLYTALTRARGAAVLIGDEAAIARAVAETRDQERRTGLASLLRARRGGGDGPA
jgi:exodeoxyribonuclease V alpha subunit